MPWTEMDQARAEKEAADFQQEFDDGYAAWAAAIQSGDTNRIFATEGNVTQVVQRWKQSVERLKGNSDSIASSENIMDSLGALASQISEEKSILKRLRGEAVTRSDQSDSVNPKIRPSPYTNILGLNRVFRSSTRFTILMTSIAFGILALGALGALVVGTVQSGTIVPAGLNGYQRGGSRRENKEE